MARRWFHRYGALALAVVLSCVVQTASAASLVRDAEIEQTLRIYTTPLLTAAGIDPKNVRIFIVNDPSLNAYVAGGMNIFIHTGLILASEKPGMLVGVIAHEIGHISGAHLSQMEEKTDRATLGSVLGAVLGAAAIAGGAPEAGAGILIGSQNMSLRNLLSDIRGSEDQADQAALRYLDEANMSSAGLLAMFEVLRRGQSTMDKSADPYLQTHPLTTSRIARVRNHLNSSDIPIDTVPRPFIERHARMLARLRAFLWDPERTLQFYPESDTSVASRYARAIAYYRMGSRDVAVSMLTQLTSENAKDPFFHDTIAQINYESGYPKASVSSYKDALRHYPDSALILTDLARALVVINEPAYLREAVGYLEKASAIDDSNPDTWRLMATAYGKLKNNGMAYVALAQEAALKAEPRNAIAYADNALELLPKISAGAQLARDIKTDSEHHLVRQREGKPY